MNEPLVIEVVIGPKQAGLRLDKALATHPEIQTRSRAAKLIDQESVRLSGQKVKASQKTTLGEVYLVTLPQQDFSAPLSGYDFPLEIFHEDKDLIVVNKPAGLVVHPAAGHFNDTLVNALVHHSKDLSMGFNELRPGIVHRLDKDTSGLLVIAKNDRTQEGLARQFKDKTVERRYWAIVLGKPKDSSGIFRSYLKRHPVDRKRFASEKLNDNQTPKGKLAITHYKVLATHASGLSLIECRLETGRTHQIRIHLSEAGFPIVGDSLYGSLGRLKNIKAISLRKQLQQLQRLGLHAFELGFTHPSTQEHLRFVAPWPQDLLPLCEKLEFYEQSL